MSCRLLTSNAEYASSFFLSAASVIHVVRMYELQIMVPLVHGWCVLFFFLTAAPVIYATTFVVRISDESESSMVQCSASFL
jgi:hypothetical protein